MYLLCKLNYINYQNKKFFKPRYLLCKLSYINTQDEKFLKPMYLLCKLSDTCINLHSLIFHRFTSQIKCLFSGKYLHCLYVLSITSSYLLSSYIYSSLIYFYLQFIYIKYVIINTILTLEHQTLLTLFLNKTFKYYFKNF